MGKSGHVYTPKETKLYEQYVRDCYDARYGTCKPFSGPVVVTMTFRFKRGKNQYLKSGLRDTAPVFYTQTPDLDNIEKAVLDALNKVAYVDDKQIVRKYSEKTWGEENGIDVWIKEMES